MESPKKHRTNFILKPKSSKRKRSASISPAVDRKKQAKETPRLVSRSPRYRVQRDGDDLQMLNPSPRNNSFTDLTSKLSTSVPKDSILTELDEIPRIQKRRKEKKNEAPEHPNSFQEAITIHSFRPGFSVS